MIEMFEQTAMLAAKCTAVMFILAIAAIMFLGALWAKTDSS